MLRPKGSGFNQRRWIISGTRRRKGADVRESHAGATFVAVDRRKVVQPLGFNTTATWLVLQRAGGQHLLIHSSNGAEWLTLVDRFMAV